MASSLGSVSGVDRVGEDDDNFSNILDLLNFKVVDKSPSDQGYFDDSGDYPSELQYYAAEFIRLQTQLDFGKKFIGDLKKKLGSCETENGKLKRKVTMQQKQFGEAKTKLREQIKSIKAAQKREISQIKKENRNFQSRNMELDTELANKQRLIKDLQVAIMNKDKQSNALKQDNVRMKNELEQKIYELSMSDRRMEGHQKLLDIEELNHQNAQIAFKNKITDLEYNLVEKANQNEILANGLSKATREKDDAVNLCQRLSAFVKSCNDDLEVNIFGSLINKFHNTSFLTEISMGEVNPQPENELQGDEERRLKKNINSLSCLVRNTFKLLGLRDQEETKGKYEPRQRNPSLSSSLSPSLHSSNLYGFSGYENRNDNRDKAATMAHLSESNPSTRNGIEGEDDQPQEPQLDDPYYLPLTSPITPVGGLPESSSPSRDNF